MRVLILEYKNIDSYEVIEVIDMGFHEDITGIKDPYSKNYNIEEKPISGLYFLDRNNNYHYLPGITMEQCNKICMAALKEGFVDLTKYGESVPEEVCFPDES